MKIMKHTCILIACLIIAACFAQKKKQAPQATKGSFLARYDLSEKKPKQFKLPKKISEASGLAMSADGRLFSHDDERGVVYQVDYSNGKIIKQFSLGRFGVKEDFEGIAIKGAMMYLVASNGTVFEFPEADDGQRVEFNTFTTFLTSTNDVEGLEYDPQTDCLLLACKENPGKGLSGVKAVYAFSLKTKKLEPDPRYTIPLRSITKESAGNQFKPSGLALHPSGKSFFMIAAHGESIIEFSRDGTLLAQQSINHKANLHPEGITFAPDSTLIICNDGQGGSGYISIYPQKR